MRRCRLFARVGSCALLLFVFAPDASAVRFVSPTGSNTPPYDTWGRAATNIQTAIDAASAGENIFVTNGTYCSTGAIAVSQGMFIRSVNGAAVTRVNGRGLHRGFHLYSAGTTLRLEGFTITNCWDGGVYVQGNVIVQDCVIAVNSNGNSGGGVMIGGTGVVQRCVIEGNRTTSAHGGGISCSGGLVQQCTIRGNRSRYDGGGVYLWSGGIARNCAIVSNRAELGDGAGVHCGNAAVENCTIIGNFVEQAGRRGGGVYCTNGVVRNCIVYQNNATDGSNWYNAAGATWERCATTPSVGTVCVTADPRLWSMESGDVRLYKDSPCIDAGTNQTWMTNTPDYLGHPRICNNKVDIGADEFSAAFVSPSGSSTPPYDTWAKAATNIGAAVGVASNGCAVLITNGEYALTATTWVSNSVYIASVNGAAVTRINGRNTHQGFRLLTNAVIEGLTISNCVAQGGGALNNGGAVYCRGGNVRDCVLAGNMALSAGGAVYVDATGVVERCSIVGNTAAVDAGGGVYLYQGGVVQCCTLRSNSGNNGGGLCFSGGGEARSCLVYDNSTGNGGGGAILYGGGIVDNCTIYNNSASHGGGTECSGGGLIRNSIVWSNTASTGPNNYNASGGNWTHCCTTPTIGSQCITNDPVFRNAGARDFRLATNSLCLNSGTNAVWMAAGTDFSGYPRIEGVVVDRGAYERSPVHYVAPGGRAVWPYTSWSDAATNIQSAVDAAEQDDSVLVSNGVYASAAAITVTQAIFLTGVNGAGATTVDGGNVRGGFTVMTNAIVCGFTITNGKTGFGGGVYMTGGAVLEDSVVAGNTAGAYGGGVFLQTTGIVRRCTISRNSATTNDGGGVYLAAGGFVEGCLIYSNSGAQAGGVYVYNGGAVRNCLITGNRARSSNGGGVLAYQPGGLVESCTVAGNSAATSGGGVYCNGGGTILNTVAYGNTASSSSNWTGGTWTYSCAAPAPAGTGNTGANPRFADRAAGNFHVGSNSPCINAGANQAWMGGATDFDGFERVVGVSVDIGCFEVTRIHYVAPGGAAIWPYTNWATAATTLQAAVNAAGYEDTILVSNGTYLLSGFLWASQKVVLASANGRDVTTIDGGNATRCVYMPAGGLLEGFTLTNANWGGDGGGVYGGGGLLVQSCRVVNCAAAWSGGGIYLNASGVVQNCDIRHNRAGQLGGGVMLYLGGLLQTCTVYSNRAAGSGGGVYNGNGGTVRNCLIEANVATNGNGGGVCVDTSGAVDNNTLVKNSATVGQGGGVYCLGGGAIKNGVIISNTAASRPNWATNGGGAFTYTCTTPLPPGAGNTTGSPVFVDFPARNYRLSFDSVCINTGTNLSWMAGATDLDGNPRVFGVAPDMGAYEVQAAVSRVIGVSGNLTFGDVMTGTTATAVMAITNSGNATITVSGIGYPAGFSGAWSGTIASGRATNVTVTFAPLLVQAYGGTVTVNSDKTSGGNTIAASGTGIPVPSRVIGVSGNLAFGDVMTGTTATAVMTITNSGNDTLKVSEIGYPAGFSGAWSGTIASGRATNVTVTFAPLALQAYGGTVTVNSDKTSGGDTIAASGTGIPVPSRVIGVSGKLAFGDVMTGTTATAVMTITNSGNDTLKVNWIGYPAGFSGAWSGTISPGRATNVTVTFGPLAVQAYGGTVTVNSDKTSGEDTIAASGTGIPVPSRVIGVSGNLAFGTVMTGTTATAVMTVTNSGNSTLTVSGIGYPGGFSGAWSGTIASGRATNVTVTFAPLLAQAYGGTVTVNSDKTSGGNTIAASGTGTGTESKVTAEVTLNNLNQSYDGGARVVTASTVPPGLTVDITYDGAKSAPSDAGTYVVTGMVNDLVYEGGATGILTVAKGTQTIAFARIPLQRLTNVVHLVATASSGLPVTFAVVSGPAMLTNGADMVLTNIGTVIVRASQAGNANWNAATGNQSFRVWPGGVLDFDGDGKTDMAVFDTAGGYWYIKSVKGGVIAWENQWGWSTAKPVPGDYNGDGKWDMAVFDTAGGYWYIKSVSGTVIAWTNQWGWSTAKPVPGDYNGDRKWDQAVFDAAGGYWYIKSVKGGVIAWTNQWGWNTAKPVPGDYNGDGKWDQAVFDTEGGYWYVKSVSGRILSWKNQWGWSTAKPVPGDYNGDGKWDQAVFDTEGGYWYIKSLNGTVLAWKAQWGWSTAVPVSGDFNGDGKYDLAVFDATTGKWYIKSLDGRILAWDVTWGWAGAVVPTLDAE